MEDLYSLIIPVYKNEDSIPDLILSVKKLSKELGGKLEVVFVVDGSPDHSYAKLQQGLPQSGLVYKLLLLSRNFGSFAAIRCGLEAASGKYFAVMAADLQEPPELALEFFRCLKNDLADVVVGTRDGREDSFSTRLTSKIFWSLYRKLVVRDMPAGGVDIFGCNLRFRNQLLQLEESHSSLIALLFWLGFRRKEISYHRLKRQHGKSAWTFRKKARYLMDSVFAFSDLPIKLLIGVGGTGFAISLILGSATVIARIAGGIPIPGYATTILMVLIFGTMNLFGLGVIGSYAWRAYENTKRRPLAIQMEMSSSESNKAARVPSPSTFISNLS